MDTNSSFCLFLGSPRIHTLGFSSFTFLIYLIEASPGLHYQIDHDSFDTCIEPLFEQSDHATRSCLLLPSCSLPSTTLDYRCHQPSFLVFHISFRAPTLPNTSILNSHPYPPSRLKISVWANPICR